MQKKLTWVRRGTLNRKVEIFDEDNLSIGKLVQKGFFSNKTKAQLGASQYIFDYKASLMDNVVVNSVDGKLLGMLKFDFGLESGTFKYEEEGKGELYYSKAIGLTDYTYTIKSSDSSEPLVCTIDMQSRKQFEGTLMVPTHYNDLHLLLLLHLVALN